MRRYSLRALLVAACVASPVLPTIAAAQGPAAPSAAARTAMAAADRGRIQGSDSAKLWIIVMSDFQCPFCKRWHDETDAVIRRDYVNTGKAKLAFINFPLRSHKNAVPTAEAAMCAAAQGKFWPYHDALFATQERWSGMADPSPLLDELAAKTAGLDVAAHRTCRSERQMKLLVESDLQRGVSAGVSGTPAFVIGTQSLGGALPAAEFVRVIEQELQKLGAGPRK
ncbi:MAG: thioredoxin domain-containing protein [Gemmatimonadaceae bacterium]|nr:thioredoxin domain-containing protein [Gemmatimonadaceae bacterium]